MILSHISRISILIVAIGVVSFGCPFGEKDQKEILKVIGPQTVRVVWEKGGVAKLEKMEKVRLFGVDLPLHLPERQKAREILVELLEGKKARVFKEDPNVTSRDASGAIFAHIIIDDLHVNVEFVRHGFSRYTQSESNSPYNQQFLQAEQEAKEAQIGVWDPDYILKEQERRKYRW